MGNDLQLEIFTTITRLGVSPAIKGSNYLRLSIVRTMQNRDCIYCAKKSLYPAIAQMNRTTPAAVEKAIRHAIKTGWHYHDPELAKKIFGNILQSECDAPSNVLFIAAVSEWIALTYGIE